MYNTNPTPLLCGTHYCANLTHELLGRLRCLHCVESELCSLLRGSTHTTIPDGNLVGSRRLILESGFGFVAVPTAEKGGNVFPTPPTSHPDIAYSQVYMCSSVVPATARMSCTNYSVGCGVFRICAESPVVTTLRVEWTHYSVSYTLIIARIESTNY